MATSMVRTSTSGFWLPLEWKSSPVVTSALFGRSGYLLDIFAVRRFKSYEAKFMLSINGLQSFRCVAPRRSVGVVTSPGVPSLESRCAEPRVSVCETYPQRAWCVKPRRRKWRNSVGSVRNLELGVYQIQSSVQNLELGVPFLETTSLEGESTLKIALWCGVRNLERASETMEGRRLFRLRQRGAES
jgi:hypothetical protein